MLMKINYHQLVFMLKKIENIPKNFIFGMDISSLISEEESGVKYYNFKEEEKDLLEIIKYVGINYIRRSWIWRWKL